MARNVEIKACITNLEALETRVAIVADGEPTEIIQTIRFLIAAGGD